MCLMMHGQHQLPCSHCTTLGNNEFSVSEHVQVLHCAATFPAACPAIAVNSIILVRRSWRANVAVCADPAGAPNLHVARTMPRPLHALRCVLT